MLRSVWKTGIAARAAISNHQRQLNRTGTSPFEISPFSELHKGGSAGNFRNDLPWDFKSKYLDNPAHHEGEDADVDAENEGGDKYEQYMHYFGTDDEDDEGSQDDNEGEEDQHIVAAGEDENGMMD